jgi:drug/metabolite transporter (DMT)-like permease
MRTRASMLPSLALALAGCFWGTGFYFGKIALEEMSVAENVTLRFLIASLLLVPILIRKWKRPTARHMAWILIAAITGVPLQFLLQFQGLARTTVSHASLLVGTLPVLLALSSAVFLGERLHGIEWGVLIVSACGAVLIAMSSSQSATGGPTLSGDLMVFGSLCLALVMILCTKNFIPLYGSLFLTALMLVIGTVALLVWAGSTHALHWHHSSRAWTAVIAQAVLATAGAYALWNWALEHTSASRAGVFLNLEPVVGTALGVASLHERLSVATIIGGLLIIVSALYFSLKPEPHPASSAATSPG